MNLCIVFDRETEALPTLPTEAGDAVSWIPADAGFERRLAEHRPAIVVLDLRRQSVQAGEIVARVRFSVPDASVLAIGPPHDIAAAESAMRAGAAGYITRCANLPPALQSMRCERMFVSSTGAKAVARRLARLREE
ncbi:MAG TPA: hypothetical protein VFL14_10865 [Xanthomonadales bacterium]|nr:hypothetical protein [Xanthomonadales bacterium]